MPLDESDIADSHDFECSVYGVELFKYKNKPYWDYLYSQDYQFPL